MKPEKPELTAAQEYAIEELKQWWEEVDEPQPYLGVKGPVTVRVRSDGMSMHIVIEEDGYRHS